MYLHCLQVAFVAFFIVDGGRHVVGGKACITKELRSQGYYRALIDYGIAEIHKTRPDLHLFRGISHDVERWKNSNSSVVETKVRQWYKKNEVSMT